MPMLKGNYGLDGPEPAERPGAERSPLEKEYYKAALAKLGGSIAFIMKDKTFIWTGDDAPPKPQK